MVEYTLENYGGGGHGGGGHGGGGHGGGGHGGHGHGGGGGGYYGYGPGGWGWYGWPVYPPYYEPIYYTKPEIIIEKDQKPAEAPQVVVSHGAKFGTFEMITAGSLIVLLISILLILAVRSK